MIGSPTAREDAGQGATQSIHEIRLGRIRATVRANQTEGGTRHGVIITRLCGSG